MHNYDKNDIRYYFDNIVVPGVSEDTLIKTIEDLINRDDSQVTTLNLSRFESSPFNSDETVNILPEFQVFLEKDEYLQDIGFDSTTARLFEMKPKAIAKWLYNNTSLFWVIFYFNDISTASDLTINYLLNNNLKVLNHAGLMALNKIITFKKKQEQSKGSGIFIDTGF